jgi:hypothetical protein
MPPFSRATLALVLFACGDDAAQPDGGLDAAADAPSSMCEVPAPGSRCLDPHQLERCTDGGMETIACQGDALCGVDPADVSGAACVATGDPCGEIEYQGACAGDVLVFCGGLPGLVVIDCTEELARCAYEGPGVGYNCLNPCDEEGVSVEGECAGAQTVRRCEWGPDGFEVLDVVCGAGTHCGLVQETGWPGCIPDEACPGVGPLGRCGGSTLVRCVEGSSVATDCSASGRVCAYGGDPIGYVCAPPGTMGTRAVSGVVRYEDRPALPTGLGTVTPLPARGITVAVVAEATDEVLAAALTADDGSYMLRYDAPEGASVRILAAATSALPARPVRVIRPDGRVHGFGAPGFAVVASAVQDLLVTDATGVAGAFNIFDQLVGGLDFVRMELGVSAPTPVFAHWLRGIGDGTYWADPGLFLLGETLDDDGYDDPVILHELGHYLEDTMGRSDSPGGGHDGSPTDPRLAWSEGFATWFSCAVREDPLYVDTNAGGAWSYDADLSATTANPAAGMDQLVSEDLVSEVLWDVADAPAGDDDPSAAGPGPGLRVLAEYFTSGGLADRGVTGVDLVDWLDGWFLDQTLASCPALRTIVSGHAFPYDFAGPAGSCPP